MSEIRNGELARLIERCQSEEKGQTRFYRALAAEAELAGREEEAERLNALHADEQHHLSRLTARLLEMGREPRNLSVGSAASASLEGWEVEAREREAREVARYREVLEDGALDGETRGIVEEILASEIHHHRELGGKWMPASPARENE